VRTPCSTAARYSMLIASLRQQLRVEVIARSPACRDAYSPARNRR
jgi:hypothetical protein